MIQYLFAQTVADEQGQRYLDVPAGAKAFSYHRKHAGQALLGGLMLAAAGEAVVVHLVLARWNHLLAWVATIATVWFGLQVLAQIRAVGIRPIFIDQGGVRLRNGAFDLAEVLIEQVVSVEESRASVPSDEAGLEPLNVGFPASHNVVLKLEEPSEATILNCKKRQFQVALLALDEPTKFVAEIRRQMPEEATATFTG
ncbi:MAG: hypothetical protein AAF394_05605 [Planctomycetota bacterium]